MIRGSITTLAVLFVLAGAMLLAGPAFGFSTLDADRGVSASTADDPNAYLGVIDNSAASGADVHPRNDRRGEVFYLNDNADAFDASSIEATAVAFDGGATNLQATVETASGGNDYVIAVRCGGSTRNNADGTLEVDVTAEGSLGVELTRTTSQPISVNCRGGGGFASVTASDLVSFAGPDAEQTITFEPDARLGNGDRVVVDLSEPHAGVLNYSEATVTGVSPGNAGSATFVADDRVEFTAQGSVNGQVELTIEGIQIEEQFSSYQYAVGFERTDTGATDSAQFSSTRIFSVEE